MAAVRFLEEGFRAYIFFGESGLDISAPSFTGCVKDFDVAKAIIGALVSKGEVPLDTWDRVQKEAFSFACF